MLSVIVVDYELAIVSEAVEGEVKAEVEVEAFRR